MFLSSIDSHHPIIGSANATINKPLDEVFDFIGANFFQNYPKWANDILVFEPQNGHSVCIGATARQVRQVQGKQEESIFEIQDYQPVNLLILKGVTADFRDIYHLEVLEQDLKTKLTYTFELLQIELFMRPFEKLIRIAIEDGAEAITENIKNLLNTETA